MIFDNTKSSNLAQRLIRLIVQGELPVGSRLPAERELEKRFGVSRVCVRKAIELLLEAGYIVRESGCRPVVVSATGESARQQLEMAFVSNLEHDTLFDIYRLCYEEFLLACNKCGIRLSYIDVTQPLPAYVRDISFQAAFVAGDFETGNNLEFLQRLRETDTRIFLLDAWVDLPEFNVVATDNIQGGVLAAQTLLAAGCRHPVLVGRRSGYHYAPFVDRRTGFINELHRCGKSCYVCDLALKDQEVLLDPLQKYLEEHPEADGVFAISDELGIEVIHLLNRMGRPIPEQVKVLGFDGLDNGNLCRPRLSSIAQPIPEIVKTAMTMACTATGLEQRYLPCSLLRRESIG